MDKEGILKGTSYTKLKARLYWVEPEKQELHYFVSYLEISEKQLFSCANKFGAQDNILKTC